MLNIWRLEVKIKAKCSMDKAFNNKRDCFVGVAYESGIGEEIGEVLCL